MAQNNLGSVLPQGNFLGIVSVKHTVLFIVILTTLKRPWRKGISFSFLNPFSLGFL